MLLVMFVKVFYSNNRSLTKKNTQGVQHRKLRLGSAYDIDPGCRAALMSHPEDLRLSVWHLTSLCIPNNV